MGVKRIVSTSFWTDGKVDEFSPEDKYFMLYLLTNPFTTQLGIYELSIKQAAFQMGYSIDTVNALLDRFEKKYRLIRFSKETNEIAIINFLRHSIVKGGAPVRDLLVKEIKAVKNKDLICYVFSHIKGGCDLNETVKNVIAAYEEKNGTHYQLNENDNDIDNDNGNDNDNEESYHDSYHDSLPNRSKPPKPTRHKYGFYKNVLLTDEEVVKLQEEFPHDYADRIDRLSEYIASTGKKYKSHLATIRSWARKDAEKKTASGKSSNPFLDMLEECGYE